MAEVYAWKEAAIYLYPTGGTSAYQTYAENVSLSVDYDWRRFRTVATGADFVGRTRRKLADKLVTLSVGHLFFDASSFQQAHSGVAFNAKVQYGITALNQSASFHIWSGVFTNFTVNGQEGALFRASLTMEADDVSGL